MSISPQPDKILRIGTKRGTLAVQFWRQGFVNVWIAMGKATPRAGAKSIEETLADIQPTTDHVRTRIGKEADLWLLLGTGVFENNRIIRHNIPLDYESMQRLERHLRDEIADEEAL